MTSSSSSSSPDEEEVVFLNPDRYQEALDFLNDGKGGGIGIGGNLIDPSSGINNLSVDSNDSFYDSGDSAVKDNDGISVCSEYSSECNGPPPSSSSSSSSVAEPWDDEVGFLRGDRGGREKKTATAGTGEFFDTGAPTPSLRDIDESRRDGKKNRMTKKFVRYINPARGGRNNGHEENRSSSGPRGKTVPIVVVVFVALATTWLAAGEDRRPRSRFTPILSGVRSGEFYDLLDSNARSSREIRDSEQLLGEYEKRFAPGSAADATVIVDCAYQLAADPVDPCGETIWRQPTYWVWLRSDVCEGYKFGDPFEGREFEPPECDDLLTQVVLERHFNGGTYDGSKSTGGEESLAETRQIILAIEELLPGVLNQGSVASVRADGRGG